MIEIARGFKAGGEVLSKNEAVILTATISGKEYLGLFESIKKVNGVAKAELEVPQVDAENDLVAPLEWLHKKCTFENGQFRVDFDKDMLKHYRFEGSFYVFGFNLLGKEGLGIAGEWLDKIRFYPKDEALKLFPLMTKLAVE